MPVKSNRLLAPRGKPNTDSTVTLTDSAYERLRIAIRDGTLAPGARVMELSIAEWLKMSRTPVRSALRRLEAEGIITHEPRNGMVVAKLDRQAINELYALRETLDGMATRLFTQYVTDVNIEMLQDLMKQGRQEQDDPESLIKHNHRFHDLIRNGANNRYLLKSMASLLNFMWLAGGHAPALLPERSRAVLDEHDDIVRAIASRDPDAAEQAARRHVREVHKARMRLIFQDPI
jgi:DNA-binding GntR family transcriptional regulator